MKIHMHLLCVLVCASAIQMHPLVNQQGKETHLHFIYLANALDFKGTVVPSLFMAHKMFGYKV